MPSILYLGTEQGVVTLKSDNGRGWKVENHALKNWAVPEVAVSPVSPNKVFAGTRGDGVWVSEDFGATWKKPCYGKPGPGKVRCLTIDPGDPKTLYAGTEPIDVFISRDEGRNWKRLESIWNIPWVETVTYPVAAVEPHARDITIDPNDPRIMYVALQVGYMLKTKDAGATWELLNKDLDADVHTIVLHPQQTEKIYIATGGHEARKGVVKGRALYSSPDGGKTWEPMAAEFREEYSIPLAIHPQNPNLIYSVVANGQPGSWKRPSGAEAALIQSSDGGRTWKKLDNELARANRSFVQSFAFDAANPNCMYAGQRSGDVFASEDKGATWSKMPMQLSAVSDIKAAAA